MGEMPRSLRSRPAGLNPRQQAFKSSIEEPESKASGQSQLDRATEVERPLSNGTTLLDADVESDPTRPDPHSSLPDGVSNTPAMPQLAQAHPAPAPMASGSVAGVTEAQSLHTTEARTGTAPQDHPLLSPLPVMLSGSLPEKERTPTPCIVEPGSVTAPSAHAVEVSESPALTVGEPADEPQLAQEVCDNPAAANHQHVVPVPANSGPGIFAVPPLSHKSLKRPQSSPDVQLIPPPSPKRYLCSSRSPFLYRTEPNRQLIPPKPKKYKYPPRSYFEWSRPADRDYVETFKPPMFFRSEEYYPLLVELEYYYLSQFRVWSLGFLDTLYTWTEGLSGNQKQVYFDDNKELKYRLRLAIESLPVSSKDGWVKAIPKIKIETLKRYHELVWALFQTIIGEEEERKLGWKQVQEDIMDRCRGRISIEAMAFCKELLRPELSEYLPFWRPLIQSHLNKTVEELAKLCDDMNKAPESSKSPDQSKIATPDISLPQGPEQLAGPQADVKRRAGVRGPWAYNSQDPSPKSKSPQCAEQEMKSIILNSYDLGDWGEDPGDWDESLDSFWDNPKTSSSLHDRPLSMEHPFIRAVSS